MKGRKGFGAERRRWIVGALGRRVGLAVLTLAAFGLQAVPQIRVAAPDAAQDAGVRRGAQPESGDPRRDSIVRVIDDPNTGTRWAVVRDAAQPGGPGRLIKAEQDGRRASAHGAEASQPPVIRVGEHLVAEEHTSRVEATLEAVALESATAGSSLAVRLKMGGRVLRAVAVAPGRVLLNSGGEAH